jgi:hypothetical protein
MSRAAELRTSKTLAIHSVAHISRVADRGSDVPVPPPSACHLRHHQPHDLGDHPGSDGEIGPLQTEGEERGGIATIRAATPPSKIAGIGSIPARMTPPNIA